MVASIMPYFAKKKEDSLQQRPSVVIVLSGTKMPRGGLTSSALNRASRLAERGYDVHLCTFDYRPDFGDHVSDLNRQDLVAEDVRVHNFFEDLRRRRDSVSCDSIREAPDAIPLVIQTENNRLTRFFSPAGQFLYSELRGEGQSLWRRYYTDNRVEKRRVEYSIKGTLHRETLFVENSSVVSWVSYLDNSGCAYFTQWMDADGKPSDVFVAVDARTSKRYKSLEKAQEDWLQAVGSTLIGPVVVMIDDCTMAPAVQNMQLNDLKKIAIFHNDHNTPAHRPMVAAMKSWDAVVCSTPGQARVLEKVVPESLSVTNISQPIPDRSIAHGRHDKSVARFAFFGRLAPIKNVKPLVSAFSRVVKAVPTATLDIYGSGPLENDLKDLIVTLDLEKSVRMMGRTDNPVGRMAEYSAVLLPSAFEAFGLVIGEAMLAETPVIAFDCDFGPGDIITHMVDGILVESGNFAELSEQIIYVSRNPEKANAMGKAGRNNVLERFSNERIIGIWEQLIDGLLQ